MKDPFELARFPHRLRDAARGLALLLHHTSNARIHLTATLAVVGLGIWLRLGRNEWLWIVAAIGIVWTAEAFNTAIEILSDRAAAGRDPLIGRTKDLAAAGVLAAAIAATATGLLVFVPRLLAL